MGFVVDLVAVLHQVALVVAASHADAERTAELTAQVGEDRAVLAAVIQERP